MFELKKEFDKQGGKDFLDLLLIAEGMGFLTKKFEQLILINYFSDFGESKKLFEFHKEFTAGKNRYSSKLTDKTKDKRLPILKELWQWFPEQCYSTWEQIGNEVSVIGSPYSKYPVSNFYGYVQEIDTKSYHPRIILVKLSTGEERERKVYQKVFCEHPFKEGDILLCKSFEKKEINMKDENGKYTIPTGRFNIYLSTYYVMKPNDKFLPAEELK
jgi:hypothetical protein